MYMYMQLITHNGHITVFEKWYMIKKLILVYLKNENLFQKIRHTLFNHARAVQVLPPEHPSLPTEQSITSCTLSRGGVTLCEIAYIDSTVSVVLKALQQRNSTLRIIIFTDSMDKGKVNQSLKYESYLDLPTSSTFILIFDRRHITHSFLIPPKKRLNNWIISNLTCIKISSCIFPRQKFIQNIYQSILFGKLLDKYFFFCTVGILTCVSFKSLKYCSAN